MLTLSKALSANQARTYHAREFTSEKQIYWSRDRQGHSEWQGELARAWGLQGSVADKQFALLSEGHAFDLVLSDVQMPGRMNGIDLAEEIVKRRPSQKLVLMTGYADELERAKHLGVPILAKPFDMDDLLDLIAPGGPR